MIKALNYPFHTYVMHYKANLAIGSSWVTWILIWIQTVHYMIYVLCIIYQIQWLGLRALKVNTSCSLSDFHNFTCVATKLDKCYTSPKTIFYRSYKKFDDEGFINDVKKIPFSVCDIFDDEDDRLWSVSKLLSGVIDSNAPVKKKILKKPSVPYMNSRLRQAIHRKNMLRNAYKKGKVKWDDYRKQINLTSAINKQSKLSYFRERCDGGYKKQSFWTT